MITILAALAGAIWGASLAKKRSGNKKDIAQYAVSSALVFGLFALVVSIILLRFI